MCQAGSGAVQAKDSNKIVTCGSASKYKTASKKRRTENPATRTSTRVLWPRRHARLGLTTPGRVASVVERKRQNEIWVRLSDHSKRAIRFFAVAAMRFVRGPLEGSPHSSFKGVMHDPYSCKFTNEYSDSVILNGPARPSPATSTSFDRPHHRRARGVLFR